MTFSLEINPMEIAPDELLNNLKLSAQSAMANQFALITIGNFGPGDGIDRPIPWRPLSNLYAIRNHGGDTTPTEILSTDLMMSISVESLNLDAAECFTEVEYANLQQWGGWEGNRKIPPRPFMPLIGDENQSVLTPYAEQQCLAKAENAIESVLNQNII